MKRIILHILLWICFFQPGIAQINGLIESRNPDISVAGLQKIPFNITLPKIQGNPKAIALILSGDGGWYYFEQGIANHLAENNVASIGLDTKKYFWDRKSPEETAQAFSELLNLYGKKYNTFKFILIGYSQGAEIIPFAYNLLPDLTQLQVSSLIMLSPEKTTDFEIHVSNMVGLGSVHNTYDVISEIKKITGPKKIIIFGENENTNVPELLKGSQSEIIKIPGDHHYKLNSSLIVEIIKSKKGF